MRELIKSNTDNFHQNAEDLVLYFFEVNKSIPYILASEYMNEPMETGETIFHFAVREGNIGIGK